VSYLGPSRGKPWRESWIALAGAVWVKLDSAQGYTGRFDNAPKGATFRDKPATNPNKTKEAAKRGK
jgi:hypothetical protein